MLEHDRPLGLQVLIELHAVPCASQQPRQGCLEPFERLAPQIVPVQTQLGPIQE
jgi:hypothetical protein